MVLSRAYTPPPLSVPDLVTRAEANLMAGKLGEAEADCRSLFRAMPDQPKGIIILGLIRMKQARWDEAEKLFQHGCALYPDSIGFYVNLGRLYILRKRHGEAVAPLQKAVLLEPGNRNHKVALLSMYRVRGFSRFDAAARDAMIACLDDPSVPHVLMTASWNSLVRLDPRSQAMMRLFSCRDYETFNAMASLEIFREIRDNTLLVAGLKRLLIPDPFFERGLTWMRRWFLKNEAARKECLSLLCALARHCFYNEYAFRVEEDCGPLNRRRKHDAADVALMGCYEMLAKRKDAEKFRALSDDPAFRDLIRIQVDEPLEEARIAESIPVFGKIAHETSQAVRRQYEENPYPRWTASGGVSMPKQAREMARGKTVLVAGCGTGREPVDYAHCFPEARITAADLSRASLAYGIRKAREAGIKNIDFMQADILELGKLDRKFDLVSCCGVLHHMKEPLAGWRTLLDLLASGGIMKISLYSATARRDIAPARKLAADSGFPPTVEGIRSFRAFVLDSRNDDPARRRLAGSYDFYSISQCRDLVFHVQEHVFTLPQIRKILDDLGLRLLVMGTHRPADLRRFKEMFPDDPQAATNLDNWHKLEQERPDAFFGMYPMWLCRKSEAETLDFQWIKTTWRV